MQRILISFPLSWLYGSIKCMNELKSTWNFYCQFIWLFDFCYSLFSAAFEHIIAYLSNGKVGNGSVQRTVSIKQRQIEGRRKTARHLFHFNKQKNISSSDRHRHKLLRILYLTIYLAFQFRLKQSLLLFVFIFRADQ